MMNVAIFRTSWQAQYSGNNWLTAYCSIGSVPTPLFFHESWQGLNRAQNIIITYLSGSYSHRQAHQHLPTCSGISLKTEKFTFVGVCENEENCIEKNVHLQCGSQNIKYKESRADEHAVDSSSVNVGNVTDTNVGNIVGNPTHCRTRLRHTAEGRNN